MKKLLFCFILFLSLGLNATPSAELIFSINGSIVKVHSANKDGNHGVGSGVVIFSEPKGTWTTSGIYNFQDQFYHKINGDWG